MGERQHSLLLGQLLVADGAVTEAHLAEALRRHQMTGGDLEQVLLQMGAVAPWQLARARRTQLRLAGAKEVGSSLVLVIDDEPEIGALLRDILQSAGLRVGVAGDETEALAALSARDGCRPALIVLDLGLPGVGGVELLRVLRRSQDCQHTPVIVLTGRPELAAEIEARGLEVSRLLAKPVPARRLLAEVEAVLYGRPEPDGAARQTGP